MSVLDFICIFGAKYLFLASVAIAGLFFLRASTPIKKQMVIVSIIALPLVYLLTFVSSHLYYDSRPFVVDHFTPLVSHTPDNGFPSDHMLLSTYAAALLYPFAKKFSYILFVIAIVIGFSRVYVGVHHAIDILGSIVIIAVAVGSAYFLYQKVTKNSDLP